ncbi:M1 family aminopeptidase [Microbacterium sp. NPDC091313]
MTTSGHTRKSTFRRLIAGSIPLILAGSLVSVAVPAVAADAVDGARTFGDAMFPHVGNGGYDALDYDVAIAWTPNATQSGRTIAGSIVATSTMTARAAEPLKTFSLDFEGLEIDAVSVNGVPAAWTRDIDADAIKYKLIVTPSAPVSGDFTTTVTYHGTPTAHIDEDGSSEGWNATSDGATMLGQPVGNMTGYPHNNTPSDKATYTFTLDIPTTLNNVAGTAPGAGAAVSNGELVSKTASSDGTRTTWVWEQTRPMASELAVISIGKYDVIEGEIELSSGAKIPSWSFMDSALSTQNKTTITNRVAQIGAITRNLETLFGPYPGKSTGIIVDTVPSGISYALETQDRSFFPNANSVGGNTLIHELVHQWYGNNVAPTTWTDIWMGEGMATWAPTYYNSSEGFGEGTTSSESTYYTSWERLAASDEQWSIAPGAQTDSSALYDYQTYTRGAQFWAALRVAIGDEAFFSLIKEWQLRNAGTSRTGAELKALAEELSGRDLTAFYQDWILDADKPAWPDKANISLAADAAGPLTRGQTVTMTLTAANTGRAPLSATTVSVDVSELLNRASIDVDALPVGLALQDDSLVWTVPTTAVGASAQVTFPVTVSSSASGGTLEVAATALSLGSVCFSCTVAFDVTEYPVDSAAPVIEGDVHVGAVVTASTPGWTEGAQFTYAWSIDDTIVAGATGASFEVPATAVGADISVSVTGSAVGYTPVTRASEPVGPVVPAPIVTPSPTPSDGAGLPVAPAETALTPATENAIDAPDTARPGQTILVTVGTRYAGQAVNGWLFSSPTFLGTQTVSASGTASFTIPASVPAGQHRLVITDASGAVIGWTDIRIVSALSATGGTAPVAALWWALLLITFGAAALALAYRRRRSA